MRSALLALAFIALPAAADPITKAGDILKNRDVMDGRSVCVIGKVVSVNEKFGQVTGKHLFRGTLNDATGSVMIFSYGYFPKIALGETIEVCGRFAKTYVSPSKNVYQNQVTTAAILKDRGINAGLVDIIDDKVVANAKGTRSAQGVRPPSPTQ